MIVTQMKHIFLRWHFERVLNTRVLFSILFRNTAVKSEIFLNQPMNEAHPRNSFVMLPVVSFKQFSFFTKYSNEFFIDGILSLEPSY